MWAFRNIILLLKLCQRNLCKIYILVCISNTVAFYQYTLIRFMLIQQIQYKLRVCKLLLHSCMLNRWKFPLDLCMHLSKHEVCLEAFTMCAQPQREVLERLDLFIACFSFSSHHVQCLSLPAAPVCGSLSAPQPVYPCPPERERERDRPCFSFRLLLMPRVEI